MAYTANDACRTIDSYLGLFENDKTIIPNTKNRGIVLQLNTGERAVIFIYPLVHKQDDTKTYFDTRDSGPHERAVAWNYALQNNIKYFCLGVNDQVPKYVDYIFSLECDEKSIETLSGTEGGDRSSSTTGNQIIIPNNYIPSKSFERITNQLGTFIAVIHKDEIYAYLEKYDNRPYLMDDDLIQFDTQQLEGDLENDCPRMGNDTFDLEHLVQKRAKFGTNRIFYGAPGCGKSHHVSDMLKAASVANENIIRVTFHPEYANCDFIGQIIPTIETIKDETTGVEKEIVKYVFNPGPFTLALQKAYDTNQMVFLIIEEINRGNAAAIFGDMFQLLDRWNNIGETNYCASEYPVINPNMQKYLIESISDDDVKAELKNGVFIPSNLTIYATMNSSDQNVFTLDTAFKRRWSFEQISNDIKNDADHAYKTWYVPGTKIAWEDFLDKLNDKILDYKLQNQTNEDKRLGKYFVTKDCLVDPNNIPIDVSEIAQNFAYKVLEYVWNDVCKIGREDWFDTETYKTLENLIYAFVNPKEGETPLSVFQNITF